MSHEKNEIAHVTLSDSSSVTIVARAMPAFRENLCPAFLKPARRSSQRRCAEGAQLGAATAGSAIGDVLAEGSGEFAAPIESVRRFLSEGLEKNLIEVRQIWAVVAEPGRVRVQVLPDHRDRIGVPVWRRTGEQVKCGRRQRVLVGAAVDRSTQQLLGGRVGDGSDGRRWSR